jgi:hypothetical protein
MKAVAFLGVFGVAGETRGGGGATGQGRGGERRIAGRALE